MKLARKISRRIAPLLAAIGLFAPVSLAQNFTIASTKSAALVFVSKDDFKVVSIAADAFAGDVELVSGKRSNVATTNPSGRSVIVFGTIGSNPFIDKLIKSKRLDVSTIRGKRETYVIATIAKPARGIEQALVVAGSDRRGTAFGIFQLSQMIGVSPWVWWADVAPEKRATVSISSKTVVGREPAVRYRGIFINDEDWGFQPWAAKTYEPESGNPGPKTYARVFELLLRLKANTCWPAMHEVTKPFNEIAGNAQTADDYAIVMGSSHAEPMLRNNVGEWKLAKENYNFLTNEKDVTDYWRDRAASNGKFENIYTIGMRGIHDSAIQGPKSQAERIPLLEKIFGVQRRLLESGTKKPADEIPQIFCPYKEVLADYRAGLKVPDDVTVVFPDDNFGYIRYFPTAEEQKRKGGFGVYYHISYLGRPLSYLWLNSTPPALIREEMSKAYANGMDRFWMLNVGDIKPAEIGIEYFMRLANDPNDPELIDQKTFLAAWAAREFGTQFAGRVANVMDRYFRFGFQRKPEHLQWFLPGEDPKPSVLSDQEIDFRLYRYAALRKEAEEIASRIDPEKRDAFYELVLYPVRSAAAANERFFAAERANAFRAKNSPEALVWARRSIDADRAIETETVYFNEILAGGKWRGIVSPEMGAGQWPSMRVTPPKLNLSDFDPSTFGRQRAEALYTTFELISDITVNAGIFQESRPSDGFEWKSVYGLGRTGNAVTVFPQRAKSFDNDPSTAPVVSYSISPRASDEYFVDVYFVPTQPLVPGNGLRVAVSIDDGPPVIITSDKNSEVGGKQWSQNVLNSASIGTGRISIAADARNLKLIAVDTGVVVDRIVLRRGGRGKGYFGPPETGILN